MKLFAWSLSQRYCRVWRDNLENVPHTFSHERAMVDGALISSSAFRENRVFAEKRGEVLRFLTEFGRSRDEAEDVIKTVGLAL